MCVCAHFGGGGKTIQWVGNVVAAAARYSDISRCPPPRSHLRCSRSLPDAPPPLRRPHPQRVDPGGKAGAGRGTGWATGEQHCNSPGVGAFHAVARQTSRAAFPLPLFSNLPVTPSAPVAHNLPLPLLTPPPAGPNTLPPHTRTLPPHTPRRRLACSSCPPGAAACCRRRRPLHGQLPLGPRRLPHQWRAPAAAAARRRCQHRPRKHLLKPGGHDHGEGMFVGSA